MTIQEELNERLEILYSANMIEEKVVKFCQKVIEILFEERESYPKESLEIFVTHLAIATQRIIRNEAEADIDEAILNSLKKEEIFHEAERMLNKITSEIDIEFPSSEKNLLLIHLCNICSSK